MFPISDNIADAPPGCSFIQLKLPVKIVEDNTIIYTIILLPSSGQAPSTAGPELALVSANPTTHKASRLVMHEGRQTRN